LYGVVKRGLLAAILRRAGLIPAEFLKLLDLSQQGMAPCSCAADRADYAK